MEPEGEPIQDVERARRLLKRDRVKHECSSVPEMFALWQETTDLVFRTNLDEDSRVEELRHLATITSALSFQAHQRSMPRECLHKLQSVLRTLMPRTWFQNQTSRDAVASAVHAANVEAQDLYFANTSNPEAAADPIATFHEVALDLLEEARAYLQFRQGYGREWDELRRRMPNDLLGLLVQRSHARDALSEARFHLKRAVEDGAFYGSGGERVAKARKEAPETLEAVCQSAIEDMQEVVIAAEARFAAADKAESASQPAWQEAERRLAREWRGILRSDNYSWALTTIRSVHPGTSG